MVRWVLEAARVEPRVAVALVVVAAIFAVSSLAWAVVIVGSGQGIVTGFLGWLFMTLLLSSGISFPLFIPLAWSALWLRQIIKRGRIYEEHWVNPATRMQEPWNKPGFMRRLNGKRYLYANEIVDEETGEVTLVPLRPRRKEILFTTTDVYKAVEQTPLYLSFLRKNRFPAMPVRAGALAVIIGVALFMGFALVTDPGTFS